MIREQLKNLSADRMISLVLGLEATVSELQSEISAHEKRVEIQSRESERLRQKNSELVKALRRHRRH